MTKRLCSVCPKDAKHHCTNCKTPYCSRACQSADWKNHKRECKRLAKENAEDSQLRLSNERSESGVDQNINEKEAPPVVEIPTNEENVNGPLVRLAAMPRPIETSKPDIATTSAASEKMEQRKTANVNEAADWRHRLGRCGICLETHTRLDLLTKKACCNQMICNECYEKCRALADRRCPLCRAPPPKSNAEDFARLQKHVAKGDPAAQNDLGSWYRDGDGVKKSAKRAVQLYEASAKQGYAPAQCNLGICYQEGTGVKLDLKRAARYYRLAADQGYPKTQYNLGCMYYDGLGVAQSFDEAAHWWKLASEERFPGALRNLGICYERGDGVPRDLDEARRLYKLAVAAGHSGAQQDVKRVEAELGGISPR